MKSIASILIAFAAAVILPDTELPAASGCGCDNAAPYGAGYVAPGGDYGAWSNAGVAQLDCNCHLPPSNDGDCSGSLLEFQSGSRQMNEAYQQ